MIWILMMILSLWLVFYLVKEGDDSYFLAFTIFMIFLTLFFGIIITGISTYPRLVSQREKALALKSEIETIRGARYDVSSGFLVGGSLDNIQQSKVLAEYIKEYAKIKANYNAELERAKIRKRLRVFKVFGTGLYISKEVLKLEKL